eukprot:2792915-Rhodomonas_salina.2
MKLPASNSCWFAASCTKVVLARTATMPQGNTERVMQTKMPPPQKIAPQHRPRCSKAPGTCAAGS